jgi:hypothetical protein
MKGPVLRAFLLWAPSRNWFKFALAPFLYIKRHSMIEISACELR